MHLAVLSHKHHRICSTTTLICMACLYASERLFSWQDAFLFIAMGYCAEALFEALRPEFIPPSILA